MGKGRAPCCDKTKVKKGPWSPAEDLTLIAFIQRNGHENWRSLPKLAGLARCGKSCRLRWINYLRPDVKRGNFTPKEEETIMRLHESMGNKWSKIASYFPGRTDNEIKNVWNTHLKKRVENMERLEEGDEVISSKDVSDIMISSSSSSSSLSSSCNKGKLKTDQELDCEQKKRIKTVPLDDTNLDVCNMVNKPLGVEDHCTSYDFLLHDIPNLEADFDFWSMLDMDNLGSHLQTSEAVQDREKVVVVDDDHHKCSSKEAEQRRWLKHLETELELEAAKEEDELWMANSQIWPELAS